MFFKSTRGNAVPRNGRSKGLALVACALSAIPVSAEAAEPAYTLGSRATVLADKAGGLSMFPEAPITILKTSPQYEVLIPAAYKTVYCKGPSMDKLVGAGFALSPSTGRSYDRVSAHITSVWTDPVSKELYGVFNGNDSDDVPRLPGPGIGYRGRYYTAALAKSTDGGTTFSKIGPILSVPKNSFDVFQGDAFGNVVMSPDRKHLYLFYGDTYNGVLNGGIQTCVARATVESKGLPGSWMKWYAGNWNTPGLSKLDSTTGSGLETSPVVGNHVSLYGDAMHPHVSYCEKLAAYVMVYVINVHEETLEPDTSGKYPPAELSGIYIAYSKDAINWGGRKQLVKAITIDYPGREVAMHPTLVIDENASSATSLKATLYYGYNAKMWWGNPATQFLVSQSVEVSGLSADQYPPVSAHFPGTDRGSPAYSVSQGGAGEILLAFGRAEVGGLRIVGMDGKMAGRIIPDGAGKFRVRVPGSTGPLFLQGRRDGRSFSGYLRRP